jgi:FkbM family methyltransferase
MQFISIRLLKLAMNGVGYNNWWSLKATGEEGFLKFLAKHDPKLIIDIGANVGQYSKRLLMLTNAKVIAFEPLPMAFTKLLEMKSAYPDRFFPIQKGVGSINSALDLHYGDDCSQIASFSENAKKIDYVRQSNVNVINVDVVSLDNFLDTFQDFDTQSIDLLKIDAEGLEYEILLGAKSTILKRKPKFIQFEVNLHLLFEGRTLHSFASLLAGYSAFQLLPYGSGLNRIDPSSLERNIFSFSNFVFIRNNILIDG